MAVLAIFALFGCEKLEPYSIDAPSDLKSKIDSIAAEKAKQSTGDTTYIDIATAFVGADDNSSDGGLLSPTILRFPRTNS